MSYHDGTKYGSIGHALHHQSALFLSLPLLSHIKNNVTFVSYSSKYQKLIKCSYLDWYYKVSFLISANCVFGTDKWAQPNANKCKQAQNTYTNMHKMYEQVQTKAKWAPNKCKWAHEWVQNWREQARNAWTSANQSWMNAKQAHTSMHKRVWMKAKCAKHTIVQTNECGWAWTSANQGQTSVTGTTEWCKWMGTTGDDSSRMNGDYSNKWRDKQQAWTKVSEHKWGPPKQMAGQAWMKALSGNITTTTARTGVVAGAMGIGNVSSSSRSNCSTTVASIL